MVKIKVGNTDIEVTTATVDAGGKTYTVYIQDPSATSNHKINASNVSSSSTPTGNIIPESNDTSVPVASEPVSNKKSNNVTVAAEAAPVPESNAANVPNLKGGKSRKSRKTRKASHKKHRRTHKQ
jgi:hypothetical protein